MRNNNPARGIPIDTAFRHALAQHQAGRVTEAESIYARILAVQPGHFDAMHLAGVCRHQLGDHEAALRLIGAALVLRPDEAVARNNLGGVLLALGRIGEALEAFVQAIAVKPDYAEAHNNRANALLELGRTEEALAGYDQTLALHFDNPMVHYNRGNSLQRLGRRDEATAAWDRALAMRPDLVDALNNKAAVLAELDRHDEALACYDRALAYRPNDPATRCNRANSLLKMKRYEAALAEYDATLCHRPDTVEACNGRGIALLSLHRVADALASFDRAVSLKPDYAAAHYGCGMALRTLNRYGDALLEYDRAIAIDPDYVDAHHGRGGVLLELNRHTEAFASLDRALALRPERPEPLGPWLFCKLHLCRWQDFDADCRRVAACIAEGAAPINPFAVQAIPLSPLQRWQCARAFAPADDDAVRSAIRGEVAVARRITLGYFSSDFGDHPVGQLIAGMIEAHDRTRFQVFGFSLTGDSGDPWRIRLEKAFDRFVPAGTRTEAEIAGLARELGVDIAIDLNGFTRGGRMGIFARRPAPLSVNYLGYPGTLGVDYYDYIVADATIVPEEHAPYYSEKIIRLPHSYQINDSSRAVSPRVFSRQECGLPEQGFVFCCFNASYKITPDVFAVWLRLLRRVVGSVLWLSVGNPVARANLRDEAERGGVAAGRLVFTERVDALADHLARHRLADLFLDTFHFNAHTTASDALWTGLPVLTRLGETYAGRVAASLLKAVGLDELVTHSTEEYEALALELATDPARLAAIRDKLAANRSTYPLFNTALTTRHLESAYAAIWRRHQTGLAPEHVNV